MAINRISSLGKKAQSTIPALIQALDDKNSSTRGAAIYALGNMGSEAKAAKPKIIAILQNETENNENRENAAMALGEMGKDAASAVPVLINILENQENPRNLALGAALALNKIDSHSLIFSLVKRLSDKDFNTISVNILSNIASKMKDNQNIYSDSELNQAISEFETALEIIDNSENEFPQDKIKLLRESVEVLKQG